jgi:hypothetical protein
VSREQTIAIVSAALLAALIGLALFLALQALRADEILAQVVLNAGQGRMQASEVMGALSAGERAAHAYLSK